MGIISYLMYKLGLNEVSSIFTAPGSIKHSCLDAITLVPHDYTEGYGGRWKGVKELV